MPELSDYTTYKQLLDTYCTDALALAQRIGAEQRSSGRPRLSLATAARTISWLTALVCRAVALSRTLEHRPTPSGAIGEALERMLPLYEAHRMDLADYHRAVDAELDADDDREDWDDVWDERGELREQPPHPDLADRPPVALIAELCRDFGMVLASVPAEWLTALSPTLRAYCARAALASIQPPPPTTRLGDLMER